MSIKNILKEKRKKLIIWGIIIILISWLGFNYYKNNKSTDLEETNNGKTLVRVQEIVKNNELIYLETSGTVKPMKSIGIKTLASGNILDVAVEEGAEVRAGQTLAYLYDEATETNYSSALSAFTTAQNSYDSTVISSEKTLQQAKLGLDQAKESKKSAQSSYENAINNLVNSTKSQLNSIYNILDFTDGILGIDNEVKYPGLKNVFSVKNAAHNTNARNSYLEVKDEYNKISKTTVTKENVKQISNEVEDLTQKTKTLVDNTLLALYSSISSSDISQAALSSIISNTVAQQSAASGLISSQLASDNMMERAESGLTLADLGLKSAETAMQNAEQAKILTVNGAENGMRAAKTGYDLASISKSRLVITAPFSGVVSKKTVEIGDQVNMGQQLFELSVVNYVKIEVSIPFEGKEYISIGDEVSINENIKGLITQIDPIADPMSKKIKVEVGYDNTKMDLIPESFTTIKIPLSKLSTQEGIFIIPLSAMELDGDKAYVKVVKEDKIESREVEYMQILNNKVAIKKGLSEGDKIVIENGKTLSNGSSVEIQY